MDNIRNSGETVPAKTDLPDELTGLIGRKQMLARIDAAESSGVLLVIDIEDFWKINNKFGHLQGDICLKTAAELLGFIIYDGDILSRVDGDMFAIYAAGEQNEEITQAMLRKITRRFQSYNEHAGIPMKVTVASAVRAKGQNAESLLNAALENLAAEKAARHRKPETREPDNWIRDMKLIRSELVEEIAMPGGAYCRDFESFKTIYRYLERCMRRSNQKACIVLISLADSVAGQVLPIEKCEQMHELGSVLETGLRLGDVYTRYSSCQYLVLLTDVTLELAEKVVMRIRERFMSRKIEHVGILMHYCYELQSVKLLSDGEIAFPDQEKQDPKE